MTEFFKTSTTWVVDFLYDGSLRRWFKLLGPDVDAGAHMTEELRDLHGSRARLVSVRLAAVDEEEQFLRGEAPVNAICPTGRRGPESQKNRASAPAEKGSFNAR